VRVEHKFTQLRCDVLYSQAKLAEQQGNFQSAANFLSDCVADARQCRYEVSHRIAEARRHWLGIHHLGKQWDGATFHAYQRPLDFLDWHLWAVRYAAQSRLRGARRFVASGAEATARVALQRTHELFRERSVLSGESDKRILAVACAGLAALGITEPWAELAARNDMQKWSAKSAVEVWAEVV
jgi:hypothetical protein